VSAIFGEGKQHPGSPAARVNRNHCQSEAAVAIRTSIVPFLSVLEICICAAKFETADQTMIVTGHVI
jgi:hypothetical protein